MEIQSLIWLGLIILFVILEASTYQLVSIWFAVGAVFALFSSIFTENILLQASVFVIVSMLCILALRPLAKNKLKSKPEHTNADRSIGKTAIVTKRIDNDLGEGQVNVSGQIWSARTENNQAASLGDEVEVVRIEGVKLIVAPKPKKENVVKRK